MCRNRLPTLFTPGATCDSADQRLKQARAAAEAAAATMHKEIVADIEPPPTTDPKIAVMNLIQARAGGCSHLPSIVEYAQQTELSSRVICTAAARRSQ